MDIYLLARQQLGEQEILHAQKKAQQCFYQADRPPNNTALLGVEQ